MDWSGGLPRAMSRGVLLFTITAIAVLFACGGEGIDAPAADTRAVEGSHGWRLAVPSAPVTPGDEVKIWFNGSALELGPRVDIRLEVRTPDRNSVCCGNVNLGGPGWTSLPLRRTGMVGTYTVAIRDSETGETFVEADFLVAE
ncbi:MAG: hypothetical protein IIA23_03310 [Chloroflexi bacterium]|nr:hypothetical protein [Chloroflexota bacterium]